MESPVQGQDKPFRRKQISNEQVIRAFAKKGCNHSATADALGITRATLWKWRKEDPELNELMTDAEESLIDFSESKLIEAIQDGNLTAILFHLKTKGKSRGYVEGQEIKATVATTKPMTQEEAQAFLRDLENKY